jgi:hypothetical protein
VRSRPLALHEKACGTGRPAGVVFRGHRVRPPVGAGWWRARDRERRCKKEDLENIWNEAGMRANCLTVSRSGAAGGVHAGAKGGKNRDRRASCPGSFGNFGSRERNGAFGLTARVGETGHGSADRPKSGEERRLPKFAKGAPTGERKSVSFEA